ncbi:MAX gene-associated protein-like [Elgaria multicarinata webbii]|uniref:MAX gene-associated protein-like n=1 Tax=Elgaria multicarinata webbii TaxID=159646 RepID=UPI002FCD2D9C
MKKQLLVFGSEAGGTALNVAPALYVLVKQSTGKSDQSALVANRDDSGLSSSATTPIKPKVKTFLPAHCTSGSTTVTLDNNNMWNEFYHRSTEMILTKQGGRMFPYCRYWITGLEANLKYILVMDISPVDNFRYKWNGHSWEPSGKAEPHVLGRVFIHPESPSIGHYWMQHPVSFYKLKLTNNTLDQEGHIILHSMHRYLPRLHLVPADKATEVIQLNGPDVQTFTFPQTEFFAVTAYQNIQITQLKIDYNPFVKGFRKIGLIATAQDEEEENDCSKQGRGRIPSNYRCPTESNVLDLEHRDLGASCNGEKIYHSGLEKKSLNLDTNLHVYDAPVLKEEVSECSVTSPCESDFCVKSLLNSNGGISISIKDDPIDDHGYEPSVHTERILVKQEPTDKEPEECFGRDDNFILEKQLKKHSKMGKTEMESIKQPHSSLLGVAEAKMLKLESRAMPESYLRSCDNIAKNLEGLDNHTIDKTGEREELQNVQAALLTTCFADCQLSLQLLETKLLEDLKTFRHKQVIHPSLQEVGLKLGSVDPTLSIDLKYLGVQLPLRSSKDYVFGNNQRTNPSCQDSGLFISRTGKTNDFRKIKGWQGRFHSASRQEDSLKNRSAFCSDKLDEYLESERKLMETNVGFSSNVFNSPVACELPSKSTNSAQALDSVLTKKSTISPPSAHTFKPLSLPSVFRKRKRKIKNKQAARGRVKSSKKFAVPLNVQSKQKHNFSMSLLQQEQTNHPLSLSNTQMKLVELEDCALRDGKPQTYITEDRASYSLDTLLIFQVELLELEDSALQNGKPRTCITKARADLSLAALLTTQASLKSKPLCKIIGSQDPPSGNSFCKVESIRVNLAFEKYQPTLPCRTGCTFECLKRRMALIKEASMHKQHLNTSLHGILANCNGQEEEWEQEQMNKRMRSNVESVYNGEPDKPVANFPGWAKEEIETDAEPFSPPSPTATKPMQHVILPHSEMVLPFKSTYSGVKPEQLKMPKFKPLIQEEHNYGIPLNFEKMRSYAFTPKYKGNIGNKMQQERIQQTPGKCFGEDCVPDPLEESHGTECDPGVSDIGIPSSGKSVLPEKPACHSSSASVCPARKRGSFEELKVNAIICDKHAVMTKRALDNTYAEEELSSEITLYPEVFSDILSDHSYISWKPDNEEIKVTMKKQHARYLEDVSDEVAEKCWQTEVLAENILQESSTNHQEAVQFKGTNREEANTAQMQSPATDSEGAEQIQLTLTAAELQEQHQTVSMNCAKKQQKGTKLLKTQWENQNYSKLLGKHRKERGDSIEIECSKEKQKKEPEINCAKNQNYSLERKYVDTFQEPLLKTNTDIQENCNTSSYKNGITSFQGETQTVKGDIVQVSRAWNKTSWKLVAKCLERNASKINHHKNGHISIDITNDPRGNGEKNADSAEEKIDGISDYQVESLIKNTSPKDEFSAVKTEENRPAFQEVEAMASEVTMYDSKLEENKLLANQPESCSESITYDRNAITSEMAEKDSESAAQFSSDSPIFQPDVVLLDHCYIRKVMPKKELDFLLKASFQDENDFSQDDEDMDTESLEEVSERTNISHLKTADNHALISRQLQLDHDSSDKVMETPAKQFILQNRKPKNKAYRLNHTENEQRARQKMKELFEKLKVALGLHAVRNVAKRVLLKQATEEIQRLKGQAVKLTGQKQLLLHKNVILVHKVSVLSGKPQKVILKKLKCILAKQKTIEALKNQEQQAEFVKIAETERITRPFVELSPFSLERDMKPEIMSNRHSKPSILSRKRSCDSEHEDSFMMPRIVNVMSLAAEGEMHLNLDADKNPYVTVAADIQTSDSSLRIESQEMTDLWPEEKAGAASGKKRHSIRTVQGEKENYFPQIVSSLKGFPGFSATELHIEELAGVQARAEQMDKGGDGQKSKDSLFQKEQVKLKDSGIEMELQKEPSMMHDTSLDANDLMDIVENDATRTSVLNEIAFPNPQLNENISCISEFPKSLSSGFSLKDMESCRESTTKDGSPFQFGTLGGRFKDLCLVQGSSGSVTPLLLHLEDDNPLSESGVLTFMPCSEVKDQNPNLSTITSCRSWKNIKHLAKATNVSLPIQPMKTNLEPGHSGTVLKPMPKLAPFGLKAASFLLDSGKQNTKVMPSLALIGTKTLN